MNILEIRIVRFVWKYDFSVLMIMLSMGATAHHLVLIDANGLAPSAVLTL